MSLFTFGTFILVLARLSLTSTLPRAELVPIYEDLVERQDQACANTALTRQCWSNGYSIATNYDKSWPTTGKVVSYNLEITNTTVAPDGTPREVFVINGQFPGPVITANWGDTLQIAVKNSLTNNGTSMHWHGVRQWKTNDQDGTNGITECPLAPGQTRVYKFLCTQFGSTWYHSHYSDQYSDGVRGTILINGPATANYDYDLGTFPITDWYHTPAFTLAPLIQNLVVHGPPPGDNILINGTQIALNSNGTGNGTAAGKYNRTPMQAGKKYRLRLINTSTNDNFKVGLDNHTMNVISADFVPIKPFTTQWIFMGIGERYDVIITANQAPGSYWFHVVPQTGCSSNLNTNALSIFTYTGSNATALPPNSMRANAPAGADCSDPNANLVPYVPLNVPKNGTIPTNSTLDVGFAIVNVAVNQSQVQWNLNFTSIVAPWDKPTLQYVIDNNTNDFPQRMNVISLPDANAWTFWVIQAIGTAAPPIPHPMHLHGHDFYVLGAGSGTFDNSQPLNYNNPPRRDVAMLPAGGYLVLAFITDNPGAWLMHCHIAWHIGLGLGAQFLEEPSQITPTITPSFEQQCKSWNAYYPGALYKEDDSGL